MIFVVFAAIIFGFVHPGSKLLLSSGVDLLTFCILYIGIRLFVQIPIVLKTRSFFIATKEQGFILIFIGVIGALLQLTEFAGISDGLPVSVVTFLVYTHPIWTIIFGSIVNGERVTTVSIVKLVLGIAGIAVIFLSQLQNMSMNPRLMIAPIAAGLMIAIWISMSKKARKANIGVWTISFYYDLFAFFTLIALRLTGITNSVSMYEFYEFLKVPQFVFGMFMYSIFIGLFPNLLFYKGSKNVTTLTAGLILLLEPIVASLSSSLIWNLSLSPLFIIGAGLILFSGAPFEEFSFQRIKLSSRKLLFIFISIIALPSDAFQKSKVLHIWEVVPSDEGEYTNSKELKSIDIASDFAISDFKLKYPLCKFKVEKSLYRGSEETLFKMVSGIAESITNSDLVIGMTRSSFARVAARAAKGSELRAISMGAATANLAEINKNFVSIAAPWINQWEALEGEFNHSQCSKENTFGFFD